MAAFGLVILLGAPTLKWREHQDFVNRLHLKNYSLVEGTVTDFVPGAINGHPMERLVVNGHEYKYSPYTSSGFSKIAGQGGAIGRGMRVRIADIDGNIARLEIAR